MKKKALKFAFSHTLPVLAGYLFLGLGFGVLLQKAGYGFGWALLMSLTIYGGSMQYVLVDLITGGATLISTAIMTLLINIRYMFYGVSLLEKYDGIGKRKALMIHEMTDETFTIVCTTAVPEGVDKKWFYFFVSFLDQCYWLIGSTLGVTVGTLIKFNSTGIEFAMTSLFVVFFVEQWITAKNHIPAIIGVVATALCLVIFGSQNFTVPSMLLIVFLLSIFRKKLDIPAEAEQKEGE